MYLFMIVLSILQVIVSAEIRYTSGGNEYCIFEGRPYRNGERIPRDHVCHICLCHRGRVECSYMNCPPPPEGCTEFTVPNYCNPTLYICSIPDHLRGSRRRRSLDRSRRASDMVASDLGNLNQHKQTGDCNVLGVPYKTGDLMGIATRFCLECRCGRQNMFCSPRCCFKYAGLFENVSEREAAEKGPRVPEKHPLYHLF